MKDTHIQVFIMLHFLDRFNPIYPLKHTEVQLNITQRLYDIQIMKMIFVLSGQNPRSETMDDTSYSRMP